MSLCCQEVTFTFSDYRFLFLSLSLSLSQVITDKIRDDEESASIEGDWKFAAMVRRRSIEFIFIKSKPKSAFNVALADPRIFPRSLQFIRHCRFSLPAYANLLISFQVLDRHQARTCPVCKTARHPSTMFWGSQQEGDESCQKPR